MSAAVLDELLATELLELMGAELALLTAELMVVDGGFVPPLPPQATRIELRATRLRYLAVLVFGELVFCIGAFRVV